MSAPPPSAVRRAERLARCYPAAWRARYGEEFTLLLVDDICERPRSWRRTADVLRTGLLAHLTCAGLAGRALDRQQQLRASLAVLGCVLAGFLIFGISMWAQLTIGWQWSAPAAPATNVAMLVMSAAMLSFVLLGVLGALPLVWVGARTLARGETRGVIGPLLLAAGGALVFALGSRHFGHGWPGTGGHRWAQRGLVPPAVASFCWAATLWVTSYWAHPGALSSFPLAEVVWMGVSPLALLAMLAGAAKALRRLPLSAAVLRYEMWLAAAVATAMAVFLAGASSWVISGGPAPRQLFRVGAIDGVGLVVMAAALVVAFRVVVRAHARHRTPRRPARRPRAQPRSDSPEPAGPG